MGLTLVGEGSELDANMALAARLGIMEHVHFTGGIPNAAPYIAASDAMILPSRREGLPMVALESLALERPLVATDVNGTPSLVVDGTTGWLVPPEDERALAAAIVDCMRHPDEAARRARAGRELIEARFSTERMLDRLEGLLIEVRGQRRPRAGIKPRTRTIAPSGRTRAHGARPRVSAVRARGRA